MPWDQFVDFNIHFAELNFPIIVHIHITLYTIHIHIYIYYKLYNIITY
jgi:hypothetical protein